MPRRNITFFFYKDGGAPPFPTQSSHLPCKLSSPLPSITCSAGPWAHSRCARRSHGDGLLAATGGSWAVQEDSISPSVDVSRCLPMPIIHEHLSQLPSLGGPKLAHVSYGQAATRELARTHEPAHWQGVESSALAKTARKGLVKFAWPRQHAEPHARARERTQVPAYGVMRHDMQSSNCLQKRRRHGRTNSCNARLWSLGSCSMLSISRNAAKIDPRH